LAGKIVAFRIEKSLLAQVLSLLVMAGGIAVIAGWLFSIPSLTSIFPGWVTMKITTAVSFVFCGLMFFSISKKRRWPVLEYAVSQSTLVVLLLMTTMFASLLFGVRTDIENAWVKEAAGAVNTISPGMPALSTIVAFLLICLAGVMDIAVFEGRHKAFGIIGALVAALGGIAIIGYALNIPFLYYQIGGISTAMAAHTAIFFVMLGVALALLGENKK